MYEATWGAFAFLAASTSCLAVAAFVYFGRPDRTANRLLALALCLDGLNWLTVALRIAAADARLATSWWTTQMYLLFAATFAYLAFLGTLETPLSRFLRGRPMRWVLIGCYLVVAALLLVRRDLFHETGLSVGPGPWRWDVPSLGVGIDMLLLLNIAVLLFALAVALDSWRRSTPGTAARSQAASYVAAFAVRDLVLMTNWTVLWWHVRNDTSSLRTGYGSFEIFILPLSIIAFCALSGYAILRHQLFGLDIRIKWTLKQSTVAAIFIGLFFIVSESVAAFFSDRMGTYLGIVAAGTLVFAIAPLQEFAQRVADRAMPGVKAVGEMTADDRSRAYLETARHVWSDGNLSLDERTLLDRLRAHLGMSVEEATDLEREAVNAVGEVD